jgi:nucleoside-diphosphate-sugar epimerase
VRAIVTGGSGFIGAHLVDELSKRGHTVLNIDLEPPPGDSEGKFWKQRNILDKEALMADFKSFEPDSVIHLAARTDTLSNLLEDYTVNTVGTENVLDAINSTPSIERVIICSTQFVNQYSGAPQNDLDFAPHTAYGESKVITEQLTRAANMACQWTIIRPTNIWGPWHPRYPYEFWRILGKGLYLHPGGGRVTRSYGYVRNVVYQIMQILSATPELAHQKVYYLGDRPVDLLDWVNGFSMGLRGEKVRKVPRILLRLVAFTGDILGWIKIKFPITSSRYKSMTTSNDAPMEAVFDAFGQPPCSLEEGIEETVVWLNVNHPGIVKTINEIPGE